MGRDMSGRTDRMVREEILSEDRDELFMARLAKDIAMLQSAGVPDDYIRKVIGTFQYVRAWVTTPKFLWYAKRLPKGYRWSDGRKFQYKGSLGGYAYSRTFVFLPVGDDLYVKGIQIPGMGRKENITYIKDCKKMCSVEFVRSLRDADESYPFIQYWHENGLPYWDAERCLRDLQEAEKEGRQEK